MALPSMNAIVGNMEDFLDIIKESLETQGPDRPNLGMSTEAICDGTHVLAIGQMSVGAVSHAHLGEQRPFA